MFILGILSDETCVKIETELLQFKKLCEMPMSDSDGDDGPKELHSQSDIFIHKQSVSDKTVADCVEALIGTYVYVSRNYKNIVIFIICYLNPYFVFL